MKNRNIFPNIFFVILLLNLVLVSCNLFIGEQIISEQLISYDINATTILNSIAVQDDDIFMLQEHPFEWRFQYNDPQKWNSSDYFTIGKALHEMYWKESIVDWHLHRMLFSWNCEFIEYGPQDASLTYTSIGNEKNIRTISQLSIYPRQDQVTLYTKNQSPILSDWGEIDLNELNLIAEDVLIIAENNNGIHIRNKVNDKCEVIIDFNSLDNKNWEVTYIGQDGDPLLDLFIDSRTGKIVN